MRFEFFIPPILALLAINSPSSIFENIRNPVLRLMEKVSYEDVHTIVVPENQQSFGTSFNPTTWTLTTDAFVPNHYQSAPYVANGYFGQALPAEGVGYWIERNFSASKGSWELNGWPLDQPRATFGTIAGFWNLQEKVTYPSLPENIKRGGESVISGIPNWTGLVITTQDGQSYMPGVNQTSVVSYRQSMSLQTGIVQSNVTWKPDPNDDLLFQLNFTVIAHRKRLNLGIVRLDLTVNRATNFTVTDVLDGAGASRAHFGDKGYTDDLIWTSVKPWGIENVTAYVTSSVKFAGKNYAELEKARKTVIRTRDCDFVSKNLSTIARSWKFSFSRPRTISIYKYVGIASSDAFKNPQLVTWEAALAAKDVIWPKLVEEHTDSWNELWDGSDIRIPGNDELEITTRASLFHMLANSLPGVESPGLNDNSIMVSGLTSDSYAGLIFWDSDVWMYPALLCLFPDYAKSINNYRTRLLPQAIENAQSYNYSGLLFPWTSGRFGNCTATGLCKDYQYHLDHDVAQAHWNYYLHTKDQTWLREKGWPVIKNTADMFANYVVRNNETGRFDTKLLGEPDEFAYNIDNGAYTNAGIKMLLGEWAPTAAKELGLSIPKNWSFISDNMEIPYDEDEDIIIEFAGMDGTVHIKQASVTLINYPLGWNINERQAQNDMTFYARANSPDGPAMTWTMFAINTAQLQEQGCATYTYLLKGSEPYLRGPFYQFSEQVSDDWHTNGGTHPAFPFLTGHGGYLQAFIYGFAGMRPKLDALFLDPMMVPQLPEGIRIEGLKYQGATFDISIGLEETTIQRRPEKEKYSQAVTVRIGGKAYRSGDHSLKSGDTLIVPTRRPDLNGTVIPGNLAQCQPIHSLQSWTPGNAPLSAVDGSNATFWQPASPAPASVLIDLGRIHTISGISINWGATPAEAFAAFISSDDMSAFENDFTEVFRSQSVDISSPYVPEEARLIRIRAGNETTVLFEKTYESRLIKLVIEGTQGNDRSAGATVMEIGVL